MPVEIPSLNVQDLQPRGIAVNVSIIVTVACTCQGPRSTLVLPWTSNGVRLTTTCPDCQTAYRLTSLHYDRNRSESNVQIEIAGKPANIMLAPPGMIDVGKRNS